MSAYVVSRRGLPLSIVSAIAMVERFFSMMSATCINIFARSVGLFFAQPSLAACAASNAKLISFSFDRATSQNTLPVTGEIFSKYLPSTGGTNLPPI